MILPNELAVEVSLFIFLFSQLFYVLHLKYSQRNGLKLVRETSYCFLFFKENYFATVSSHRIALPQAKQWKWIMSFANLLWFFLPPALVGTPVWDCKTALRQKSNVKLAYLENTSQSSLKKTHSNCFVESIYTESTISFTTGLPVSYQCLYVWFAHNCLIVFWKIYWMLSILFLLTDRQIFTEY